MGEIIFAIINLILGAIVLCFYCSLYDDHLKKKISELPSSPGVYQYFGASLK
jgi:hypothetical protein